MTVNLDLEDIQGNVIRPYGKYGYPKARYFFLNFTNSWVARTFVRRVLDEQKVTTAKRWPIVEENGQKSRKGPDVTFNIGFTFLGLWILDLPVRTLQGMPDEFIEGMRNRAHVLGDEPVTEIRPRTLPAMPGDDPPGWMKDYDPIWRDNRAYVGSPDDVHIWISMNAKVVTGSETVVPGPSGKPVLDEQTEWLERTCAEVTDAYAEAHGGDARGQIRILAKNGAKGDQLYQAASALFDDFESDKGPLRMPTPYEHFGYTDGIGDPVFEGQFDDDEMRTRVIGRGKWMSPKRGWEPLATGEFLLGHPDESQELPPCARPVRFSKNGTFLVYRKLHQNVSSFADFVEEEAARYARVTGMPGAEAAVTLRAKIVGRWPDGVPLAKAPGYADWQEVRRKHNLTDEKTLANLMAYIRYFKGADSSDFKYGDDMQGFKTPVGAHLRRANTRDHLDPQADQHPELSKDPNVNKNTNSSLNKRRRIMRRGLPYGTSTLGEGTNGTEQGVAMMTLCASIFRQYEFVQQQWIQYGLDFNAGNSTCPLLGDHSVHTRFVINADPAKGEIPYVCTGLKNFVEPRGGEYFFVPSMTALRMIADGTIDPT